MTAGLAAMLIGAFVVPAVLLWMGHRLRKRPRGWRLAFLGALAGHLLAAPIAIVAAMVPPAEWGGEDRVRGFLGLWLLLVGPIIGGALGAALSRRTREPPRPGA